MHKKNQKKKKKGSSRHAGRGRRRDRLRLKLKMERGFVRVWLLKIYNLYQIMIFMDLKYTNVYTKCPTIKTTNE